MHDRRLWNPATITAAGIAAVTAIYAVLAWSHRWIADDGLIFVRTAREIMAGNGPVYSPFERAEATTSTLWPWLLAGCGWITGAEVSQLAVALGGALAVGGLAIATDATRRFHRNNGHGGALVPAGALVVVGVFPFWDYATSGLETGLGMCWLAVIWWLLVALRPDGGRRVLGFAIVVGLGPLVRPDFTIATVVFLVAGWRIVRPPRTAALRLAVAAFAIPLGYEVFRAGYYGTLVPLPALAKSASDAAWTRGLGYLTRFVKPHLLYIPIGVLVAVVVVQGRAIVGRSTVTFAAPLIAGVLLAAFVIRVGGDFMHGRMLLPATALVIAPVLMLPWSRAAAAGLIVLTAWASFSAIRLSLRKHPLMVDERADYIKVTRMAHPTSAADHIDAQPAVAGWMTSALRDPQRQLISDGGLGPVALNRAHDVPVAIAVGRLGFGGALAPLDGMVIDRFGLANPLGARITPTFAGSTGHEKRLPLAWIVADFADSSVTVGDIPAAAVAAARHALTCGELAELLASVREPMTVSRFWANLTGSPRRTRLVIPSDPIEAEHRFCGP